MLGVHHTHIYEASAKSVCWVTDGRGCGSMREASSFKQKAWCLHYGNELFILVNKLVIVLCWQIQKIWMSYLQLSLCNWQQILSRRGCCGALGPGQRTDYENVINLCQNVWRSACFVEFLLVKDVFETF